MNTRNASFLLFVLATASTCACTNPSGLDQRASKLSSREEQRRLFASMNQNVVAPSSDPRIAELATDMAAALDIPASMVSSAQLTSPHEEAAMVLPSYGVIQPRGGNSLVVLSTGRLVVNNPMPEPGTDFSPIGKAGDAVTLQITLNVPPGANRLSFDFNFLSAESPDFVGSDFNDTFVARVADAWGSREVASASVNSSFFYDISDTRAGGTGFALLFADDPAGVDLGFGSYEPGIPLFPDSGITGFKTVNVEVASGGPVILQFDIRDLGDGILDSAVVIDNVQFSSVQAVDPNPNLIDSGLGAIVTDPAKLAVDGRSMEAVAADGATQIVLRMKVPGPGRVQFSLPGLDARTEGGIGTVAGNERNPSISVGTEQAAPGQHYAFAVYTSPAEFGDMPANTRLVRVTAHYTSSTSAEFQDEYDIKIVRRPVVIVPDMWAGGCLRWMGSSHIYDAGIPFERTCDAYADSPTSESASIASNYRSVWGATYEALSEMRGRGVAVTQVDVVAHGMGGLLARKWASSMGYRRSDNFYFGDFNRIIFMSTPHVGTRMANEIATMREYVMANPNGNWSALQDILDSAGINIDRDGGIDDLATNSAAINGIGATDVPSHLMVSKAGRSIPRTLARAMLPDGIKILYTNMEFQHPASANCSTTADKLRLVLGSNSKIFCADAFGQSDEHDLLTAVDDQKGGVTDESAISYYNLSASNYPTQHFGIQSDGPHNEALINLFNSPLDGGLFTPSIPSPSAVARVNHCPQVSYCPPPDGGAFQVDPVLPKGGLRIASPSAGTPVVPGSNVMVTVEAYDGFQPSVVFVTGGGEAAVIEAGPFAAPLPISPEAIGKIKVVAFGIDERGAMVSSRPVDLPVALTAKLTSIEVLNGDATVPGPGSTWQLVVLGHYSDGVTRNITSPELGSLYSSSNRGVATVLGDGTVTGVGAGIASIVVRNDTVFTSITVTVGDDKSYADKPPVALCRDVALTADSTCQMEAAVNDGSYDPDGDALVCEQTPAGPYGAGQQQVTLTCSDPQGLSDSCHATVTVLDKTPPTVTVQGVAGTWPPNHKYRTVTLDDCGITVTDACDGQSGAERTSITCVTSDELPDGKGDGQTGEDVVLVDERTVKLRAERSGTGDGRVYRIHFRARDKAGNETPGVCVAAVPHDGRGGAPVDSGEAWRVCRP